MRARMRTQHGSVVAACAAVLLLSACGPSGTAPAGTVATDSAEPAATTAPSDAASAPQSTASPTPLDAEPLGVYEPGDPADAPPCADETIEYLAIPGDARAIAVRAGTGDVGVVLAHQSNGRPCQWEEQLRAIAENGMTAIAPALGVEPLAAVLAADQTLRESGVTTVVYAGASLGGLVALASSTVSAEPPAAVVAISPPATYQDLDAASFAADVDVPVLIAVGSADADFPADAQTIAELLPTAPELVEVDSREHGVVLLRDPAVRSAVDDFLDRVTSSG